MLSKDSKLYFLLFNFESIKFQIQSYTQSVGYMETLLWCVIRHLLNLQILPREEKADPNAIQQNYYSIDIIIGLIITNP